MKKFLYFLIVVISVFNTRAQLLPSIGLNNLPSNSASICDEPFYLGNFYSSGYQQGDTVNDFKLYNFNGDSLVLSQALTGGKPVLLISGSLTCPVFRAKVSTINQVVSTYSNSIKVYVIYTLEAHPTDTSVYFGYVNVTSQNTTAGILFPQSQTYGGRKQMVDTMSSYVTLNAPVFIDGPCNNWWKKFGPAPNNSYLIGTNGVVLNKHGWFHKSPDNIFCDLDSILNMNSGLCNPLPSTPGNFTLSVLNSTVNGSPQDLLYDYVDVINTSSVVTAVKIKKLQNNLPAGWQTAFCADVCYGTQDDSIEVYINPFDTIHFSLDFFTDAIADSGSVKVGYRNINKPNNSFTLRLRASTLSLDVGLDEKMVQSTGISVYPNPASNIISIASQETFTELKVYDLMGKEMDLVLLGNTINTEWWSNGIYFMVLHTTKGTIAKKIRIQK